MNAEPRGRTTHFEADYAEAIVKLRLIERIRILDEF